MMSRHDIVDHDAKADTWWIWHQRDYACVRSPRGLEHSPESSVVEDSAPMCLGEFI